LPWRWPLRTTGERPTVDFPYSAGCVNLGLAEVAEPTVERRGEMDEPVGEDLSAIGTLSALGEVGQPCPCGDGECKGGRRSASLAGREFVFAIGQVEPRFPSLGVEKEFVQASHGEFTPSLVDRQALRVVLSAPENRYLARSMCWIFSVQGMDAYVLMPTDSSDLDVLVRALGGDPPTDLDIMIGRVGPLAPPEMCNGQTLSTVSLAQVYSLRRAELLGGIPVPVGVDEEQFRPAAEELLDRIVLRPDNLGTGDESRALNYLAVRYPSVYEQTAAAFARGDSLAAIHVRASSFGGGRRLVDVILSYANRQTRRTTKLFARVDVTEEYPFLVSGLARYFDR
jgi:hypothetical protein